VRHCGGADGGLWPGEARFPHLGFTQVDGGPGELQKATAVGGGDAGAQRVQQRRRVRPHDVEGAVADGRGDEGDEVALGGEQVAHPGVGAQHL